MAKAAKLGTHIISFEKYKHLVKRADMLVLSKDMVLFKNENQVYFHENAKTVSGIECLPLHGYVIFGKGPIFFEPQSPYW